MRRRLNDGWDCRSGEYGRRRRKKMKIADFLVRTQSEGCGLVGMSARLVATGIGKGGRVGGLADDAIRNSRSDGPADRASYGMGDRSLAGRRTKSVGGRWSITPSMCSEGDPNISFFPSTHPPTWPPPGPEQRTGKGKKKRKRKKKEKKTRAGVVFPLARNSQPSPS